jgi:hypothetical protein
VVACRSLHSELINVHRFSRTLGYSWPSQVAAFSRKSSSARFCLLKLKCVPLRDVVCIAALIFDVLASVRSHMVLHHRISPRLHHLPRRLRRPVRDHVWLPSVRQVLSLALGRSSRMGMLCSVVLARLISLAVVDGPTPVSWTHSLVSHSCIVSVCPSRDDGCNHACFHCREHPQIWSRSHCLVLQRGL